MEYSVKEIKRKRSSKNAVFHYILLKRREYELNNVNDEKKKERIQRLIENLKKKKFPYEEIDQFVNSNEKYKKEIENALTMENFSRNDMVAMTNLIYSEFDQQK